MDRERCATEVWPLGHPAASPRLSRARLAVGGQPPVCCPFVTIWDKRYTGGIYGAGSRILGTVCSRSVFRGRMAVSQAGQRLLGQADQLLPRSSTVDRQPRGTAARWLDALSSVGCGRPRVGPSSAAQAVPARPIIVVASSRGREARRGLVAAADRRVAQTDLPSGSSHARVARNDLPEPLRAESGRAEESSGRKAPCGARVVLPSALVVYSLPDLGFQSPLLPPWAGESLRRH